MIASDRSRTNCTRSSGLASNQVVARSPAGSTVGPGELVIGYRIWEMETAATAAAAAAPAV